MEKLNALLAERGLSMDVNKDGSINVWPKGYKWPTNKKDSAKLERATGFSPEIFGDVNEAVQWLSRTT